MKKREYKFRAWDVEQKTMVYSDRDENLFCFDEGWWCMYGVLYVGDKESAAKQQSDILMQYTGLKDKKGKEGYESDIWDKGDCKGVIVFKDGSFCMKWEDGHTDLLSLFIDEIEFVGNIHENPELLWQTQ